MREDINIAKRVAVIIVGVPLILFLLKLGIFTTFSLILLISVMCAIEFYNAVEQMGHRPYSFIGISLGIIFLCAVFFGDIGWRGFSGRDLPVFIVFLTVFVSFASALFRKNQAGVVHSSALTVAGFFYIFFNLSFLIYIADLRPAGFNLLVFLLVMTWATDIGAYVAGMTLGRIRPLKHISPGKSLEGFIGGIAFSILAAWLGKKYVLSGIEQANPRMDFNLINPYVLGAVIGLTGQIGDLIESSIKRSCAIKDSGVLLPGHGGFLDRFDSLIINTPVFYFYLKFFISSEH